MPQQTVKQTNGIPVDANGVPMDAAWAHQVNQTIIDIMARDKGWKITKRVLTRRIVLVVRTAGQSAST